MVRREKPAPACLLTIVHGSKVMLVIMVVHERVHGKEAEGVGLRLLTASSTLLSCLATIAQFLGCA